MATIMNILLSSSNAAEDREHFYRTRSSSTCSQRPMGTQKTSHSS